MSRIDYIPQTSTKFDKDYALLIRREYDISKLKVLMTLLIKRQTIPAKYRDHALKNNWNGYRDAHITPDWLLIYRYIDDTTIRFERTGTHSDLFG